MSDIPKIEIFPGVNDVPVESSVTGGCNGSAVVQRVNSLIDKVTPAYAIWGDCTAEITWFVDTVNGSDDNDGLTELTPFLTVQKALDVISTKVVDDCWWTYIRIKGTVEGKLDFSDIRSWFGIGYWSGAVVLGKWESETSPWTLNIAEWSGEGDYTYTPGIISSKDNNVTLSIEDCNIVCGSVLDFSNLSVSLTDSTISSVGTNTCRIFFAKGYSCRLDSVTLDTTNNPFSLQVDDTTLTIGSPLTWLGDNTLEVKLFGNAQLELLFNTLHDSFPSKYAGVTGEPGTSIVTRQEDYALLYGMVTPFFYGKRIFGKTSAHFSFSINIPTPTVTRYMVGIPNKPCYLKNMVLSAEGGSATVQAFYGTNPLGTPQAINFTGIDNVTWLENIDQIFEYARWNSIVLGISAVSGVSNLFIQANCTESI